MRRLWLSDGSKSCFHQKANVPLLQRGVDMKTYSVRLYIRTECPDDVRELIHDYTGRQTDVTIHKIEEVEA